MVAFPATIPVTRPVLFTVATAPLLLVHETVAAATVLPFASRGSALNCCVKSSSSVAEPGDTTTELTGSGAVTVTECVPEMDVPLAVAVIVTDPGATPVTNPLWFTVAKELLLELQSKVVLTVEPELVSAVAVS